MQINWDESRENAETYNEVLVARIDASQYLDGRIVALRKRLKTKEQTFQYTTVAFLSENFSYHCWMLGKSVFNGRFREFLKRTH